MGKTKVDDILNTDFSKLPKADQLYHAMQKKTKIETAKEEDNVLRKVLAGEKKSVILDYLNNKHKELEFNHNDLNKFLERNQDVTKALEKENTSLAKRHLNAKVQIEEKLANIILFTEQLIKKYDSTEDAQSTIAALNVLNKSIMNYAKLSGLMEEKSEGEKIAQSIVDKISDKHQSLAKRAHNAEFKIIEPDGKI